MVKEQLKKPLAVGFLFMSIPLFMIATNPESLPLPLLIAPFALLFGALYLTSKLMLDKFFTNLNGKPLKGVAVSLAGLPVLLIILQSIGQLSIRDLLITFGLVAGLIFYFRKTDFL